MEKEERSLQQLRLKLSSVHPNKSAAAKLSLKHRASTLGRARQQWDTLSDSLETVASASMLLVKKYAGDLQLLGEALCAQSPSRFCCNNPRCSNVATASEGFVLVRGNACACGGCLGGSRAPALAATFCTGAR
jgi:hypothetical protein